MNPARGSYVPLSTLELPLPDFRSWQDGEVRLTGRRIKQSDVNRRYETTLSAEILALHDPSLALAHVHKVIAHCLQIQPPVGKYVAESYADTEEHSRQTQSRVRHDRTILTGDR